MMETAEGIAVQFADERGVARRLGVDSDFRCGIPAIEFPAKGNG